MGIARSTALGLGLAIGFVTVADAAGPARPLGRGHVERALRESSRKPPVQPYAPQKRQYLIVVPREAAAPSLGQPVAPGHASHAAAPSHAAHSGVPGESAPDPYPWRQVNLTADPYPWGWFGARRHPQTTTHRSYYSDSKDWKFSRGY